MWCLAGMFFFFFLHSIKESCLFREEAWLKGAVVCHGRNAFTVIKYQKIRMWCDDPELGVPSASKWCVVLDSLSRQVPGTTKHLVLQLVHAKQGLCPVTLHPQQEQSWRKLRLQGEAGANTGHGQQTGKHLNSKVEWQNQTHIVAGLLLACLQRQVQPQMWDCGSVVSSSRGKKFKNLSSSWRKMYAN